ncbi:MAG: SDR family NAD(P)-dependent oxidoreductase [Cytophagales bacterium]|nr:SDR family NAD(P)-dependent oxidoreductase [Cytophagales bacterium]
MDIAIIGMAGRFPDAADIKEFYRNLCSGKDSVQPIQTKRKEKTLLDANANYLVAGYLQDIDVFDYNFFNISLNEARYMDPCQRLLLEVAYLTLENSCYSIDYFDNSNTSVFIADTTLNYKNFVDTYDPTLLTGNLNSAVAGRISRFFNLRGNSSMIDTACSSGLVAVHYACNDLILNNSEYAFVGGINILLSPPVISDEDIGIVSKEGKARSFSLEANGTGFGEAVSGILLKPYNKAVIDQDIIHGVIKSIGVNQNGALSGSFTAPNSIAQSELYKKVWSQGNIMPESITYIEAHGTGTKLGDPIEIEGLDLAFKEFTDKKSFCAISSVKTNIGHTDSAAGLVGLIKVVLSLKFSKLFPSLHFNVPNPLIDFKNSATYINDKLKQWKTEKGLKKRAGVNSFGLSGINCHAIIEEYVTIQDHAKITKPKEHVITISAKTPESLQLNIDSLYEHLKEEKNLSLKDLSYSLLVGRKHYTYRYATICSTVDELMDRLSTFNYEKNASLSIGKKYIMLFYDQPVITESTLLFFCKRYSDFARFYKECLKYRIKEADNNNFFSFSFQYCFYKLLKSYNIQSKYLIGSGLGKLIVAVLKGDEILDKALIKAQTSNNVKDVASKSRIQKFLNQEQNQDALFIGMGFMTHTALDIKLLANSKNTPKIITLQSLDEKCNHLLVFLKDLYLTSYSIDWSIIPLIKKCQRIELPGYNFLKNRCWFEKKPSIENHNRPSLFVPKWVLKRVSDSGKVQFGYQGILFFGDNYGIAEELCSKLHLQDNPCIIVKNAKKFRKVSKFEYRLNYSSEAAYGLLRDSIKDDGISFSSIIHLGGYSESQKLSFELLNEGLSETIYSYLHITKAFDHILRDDGFKLIFITSNAYEIGSEVALNSPINTMATPFLKGLLTEYTSLNVLGVDFDFNSDQTKEYCSIIIDLMQRENSHRFVSIRQGKQYVLNIDRISGNEEAEQPDIVSKGTCLITGGASGIGFEIAKFFAKYNYHIIILGRTKIDFNHEEVETADKINAFKELTELGATFEYHSVDIGNLEEVDLTIAEIKTNNKKINYIIHSAGTVDELVPIYEKKFNSFKKTLNSKVNGMLLLDIFSASFSPDTFISCSSLNALIPHCTNIDYACANAFLDGYTYHKNSSTTRYISINWPGWNETGMAVRSGMSKYYNEENNIKALNNKEGIEAFRRILSLNEKNVLVLHSEINEFTVENFYKRTEQPNLNISSSLQTTSVSSEDNNSEEILSKIWHDVLEVNDFDEDSDFFDLGGHSLNGTQVISRIEKSFNVKIEFEELYDYPTIRTLGNRINELKTRKSVNLQIIPIEEQDYYSISHPQKRLWLINQHSPNNNNYNMPIAFTLHGEFDSEIFVQCLARIIKRHESLRTNFIEIDGIPKQKINNFNSDAVRPKYIDLRNENTSEERINELVLQEGSVILDLAKDSLFKTTLIQINDSKTLIIFLMHHIISDGWSVKVLLSELEFLYKSYWNNEHLELNNMAVQYKDFVLWQKKLIIEKDEVYWLDKLSGNLPRVKLPPDFISQSSIQRRGANQKIHVDKDLTKGLKAFAKDQNVSLSSLVLTVFFTLLHKLTNQNDILVGVAVANRNHRDIENLIGFFVNTVVLKCHISNHLPFEEILGNVFRNMIEALDHQNYPFDLLVEKLNPKRVSHTQPIVNVMYSFQSFDKLEIKSYEDNKANVFSGFSDHISLEAMNPNYSFTRFDLTLYVSSVNDSLQLSFEYDSDQFKSTTIEKWLSYLNKFLNLLTERNEDLRF